MRERVQAEPGITIGMLVGDIAGLRPHDLYALITQEQICIAVFCATITAHIFLPTSQRRWRMPSLA